MELYQLRGFVAVAESGHLTRAADKLHVSQPALSAQIKAVEEILTDTRRRIYLVLADGTPADEAPADRTPDEGAPAGKGASFDED